MFGTRATGWTLATLFIVLFAGIAWVMVAFLTREHQIERIDDQQTTQQAKIEELEAAMQQMARRIVQLETELEDPSK